MSIFHWILHFTLKDGKIGDFDEEITSTFYKFSFV